MKKIITCLTALTLPALALAQTESPALSHNQIVEEAQESEWISIPAEDLLVMRLAPDAEGNPREVIIQLMPAPLSQGWIHNIELLAREGWYDGISVNRVQDNYVVQWGDPNYDNPESDGEAKPLPDGLKVMSEEEYAVPASTLLQNWPEMKDIIDGCREAGREKCRMAEFPEHVQETMRLVRQSVTGKDPYAEAGAFWRGWPLVGSSQGEIVWPVHCYGMVGVGRNYSPDTGSGAELYTVIGPAPRHLDRNIALVGRIIEGIHHLSSLPRGNGELGFYADFEQDKRTPILSIDIAADLLVSESEPAGLTYSYEYLSTESESFARYAEARVNRRDPFFIHPAGGADICNIPVPVRPAPNG